MASTKVSAMTEATVVSDTDEFYMNDGGTSKRITFDNARQSTGWIWSPPDGACGDSHASFDNTDYAKYRSWMMLQAIGVNTTAAEGLIRGSVTYCRQVTDIDSICYRIMNAKTTGDAYLVAYALDEDEGLPTGSAVWSHQIADPTTTGDTTETGLTPFSIDAGWYFVGVLNVDDAGGSLQMRTVKSLLTPSARVDPNNGGDNGLSYNGGYTTPPTLAATEAWLDGSIGMPLIGMLDSTS